MIFSLNLFAKNKNKDFFAEPTSDKCREKILKDEGYENCGGAIFKRGDGTKFCGRCNCLFEELPPP